MSLVLDASLAIAWCIEEEQTPAAMAVLDQVSEQSATAPALWPLEVTNTPYSSPHNLERQAPKSTEYGNEV